MYKKYDIVVRNYYYEPFSNYSYYFPLGPSYYENIKKFRSELKLNISSERSIDCFYSGRHVYPTK